jgi:hypothetical protein
MRSFDKRSYWHLSRALPLLVLSACNNTLPKPDCGLVYTGCGPNSGGCNSRWNLFLTDSSNVNLFPHATIDPNATYTLGVTVTGLYNKNGFLGDGVKTIHLYGRGTVHCQPPGPQNVDVSWTLVDKTYDQYGLLVGTFQRPFRYRDLVCGVYGADGSLTFYPVQSGVIHLGGDASDYCLGAYALGGMNFGATISPDPARTAP